MKQVLPFSKIHYQIHPTENLFSVSTGKDVSYDDLLVHIGNLMNEPTFEVGMNGLYDFSQLTAVHGDVDVFHSTAEAMNDKSIIDKRARTAILLKESSGNIYDIFNLYTQLTAPSLIDYRIFTLQEITALKQFLLLPKDWDMTN